MYVVVQTQIGVMLVLVEGEQGAQVGAVGTPEFGARVVQLLNRHGVKDPAVTTPTVHIDEHGVTTPPPQADA